MQQPAKLQPNMSLTRNIAPLPRPNALSEKQKSEGEAFLRIFLSERDVLAYFAPAKWAAAAACPSKCNTFPTITLSMLNLMYCNGIAQRIVENNMRGLFSMARPHEPIVDNSVAQAAALFVGKFGTELPVFAMLLYFAQYLTDYKGSYGQFDLVDVLRQCGNTFMPRWNKLLERTHKAEETIERGCRETGKAALYSYLRRNYVDKGIDLHESPFVSLASFTEQELRFIESGEPLPF